MTENRNVGASHSALRQVLGASLCGVALIAGVGCSSRTIVVHDEPRLISEEESLVVETEGLDSGSIRLRAFRRHDRVFNQDYWKVQEASRANILSEAAPSTRTASVGVDTNGLTFGHFVFAVAIVVLVVVAVVGWPALLVYGVAGGSISIAGFTGVVLDDQRTTIRRVESTCTACAAASVESAVTGEHLELGPQPEQGWILLPETVRLLGGPGSRVTVRDGTLLTTIVLGAP